MNGIYAQDDRPLFVVRRDLSGGINTRQHEQIIAENQATVLKNIQLDVPGERTIRPGLTLIEDLGNSAGIGLFGFEPRGGTNELLAVEDTNLKGWIGSGTFTTHDAGFTTGLLTTMIKATCSGANGDVVLISNGTDNVHQMLQDHTVSDFGDANTDCPLTTVLTFYRNRVWALKSNLLYWSEALPSSYDGQFDRTTNNYNITVGVERALIGLRDLGLIVLGGDAIYGINPSITPAATDKPEKILDMGCICGATACQVGDDVLFFAPDGVRGVFRTQQDKLQLGQSFPLSYALKSQFEEINWAQISKASAIYWDNKYFLTLATGTSTYNNTVWIYYPAYKSWVTISGWNVARFAKLKISGEERLYAIDSADGKVYRAWSGTTDNSVAITFHEESRAEDFGQPLNYKIGGEFKIKVEGGSGTITISAALDNEGWNQLGTLSLALTGITFPTTFPIDFGITNEQEEQWHLDHLGKFKRIKFKIYSESSGAAITILESIATAFVEEYLLED